MKHVHKHILSKLREAIADEEGAISVEFVITFPLLMFWFIGSFVYFDAYRSSSQTAKVAYAISDFMSRQEDAVTSEVVDKLVDLQTKMMPHRLEDLGLRITSICFVEEEGAYKVMWSDARGVYKGAPMDELTDLDIPIDILPIMADQDSIILTEVYAVWSPHANWVGLTTLTWKNRPVIRPRFAGFLPYVDKNMDTLCPTVESPGS